MNTTKLKEMFPIQAEIKYKKGFLESALFRIIVINKQINECGENSSPILGLSRIQTIPQN